MVAALLVGLRVCDQTEHRSVLCVWDGFWPGILIMLMGCCGSRLCSAQDLHQDAVLHLVRHPLAHRPRPLERGSPQPRPAAEAPPGMFSFLLLDAAEREVGER